jgi:2-hydroxy-3-keto-5-methylthiopentenyl-1-phosphate phosphatase
LSAAAERLHRAGWELIVVSAGCSWYIERILAAAGVAATVHANPGRIEAGRGLVVEKPRDSRFFSEDVGIDKPAVVRDALSRYPSVAFAGDGPPDIAPALLVDAGMRFARGFLADELERRGEEFHHFGRWSEIVDRLCQ